MRWHQRKKILVAEVLLGPPSEEDNYKHHDESSSRDLNIMSSPRLSAVAVAFQQAKSPVKMRMGKNKKDHTNSQKLLLYGNCIEMNQKDDEQNKTHTSRRDEEGAADADDDDENEVEEEGNNSHRGVGERSL